MARPRKLTDEKLAAAQVMRLASPDTPLKVIAAAIGVCERTLYYGLGKISAKTPAPVVFAEQNGSRTPAIAPLVGSTAA
jgi:hypothetical protein